MAIDPRYIPAFSIEDVLLDKDTGAPLTGGKVYFEKDNQRGQSKPVYQITGTSPNYTFTQITDNPMVLSSIGTFEDTLGNPIIPYFYPYDGAGNVELYYIRVTSSEDVPQFDREAQPFIASNGDEDVATAYENQLSNPQFAEVLFDTSTSNYTYNFPSPVSLQSVAIAPDWEIVVSTSVSGSVTVSQTKPTGQMNLVTNPGTLLRISNSGLTLIRLRQRLYGSPNLWGNGNIAGTFVARTYNSVDTLLSLLYSQSNGIVVDKPIISATLPGDGVYAEYSGTILLPLSESIQNFPNAYIDIEFEIPVNSDIEITSVMVTSTGDISVADLDYEQTSLNRQIDHLFHYYKPQLEFKPIPSMLVGWDFPLNPAQFGTTVGQPSSTMTISTTAAYTWDQTICQSVVGNVAVVRSALTSGFQATTGNADEAFYMLQYLDGAQAREILGNTLSVNINAFRTQAGGAVDVKVYLYRGEATAVFPVLGAAGSIGGATPLAADGVFTKNDTLNEGLDWAEIPRGNLGQAEGTLSVVNTGDYTQLNDVVDLNFSGWQIDESLEIADTSKFAIVVTFSCPVSGTVITVDSIGLMKGEIATRPAPQSPNEVLLDCQYYYETSYAHNVKVGTVNAGGCPYAEMLGSVNGNDIFVFPRGFGLQFRSQKRSDAAVVQLYSPVTGTAASIRMYLRNAGVAITDDDKGTNLWTQQFLSTNGVSFVCQSDVAQLTTTVVTPSAQEGYIIYHYTVNARLGEVA